MARYRSPHQTRAEPPPRKYATDAERQAAHRNRWAKLELRTTPEQAATVESIAAEAWDGNKTALLSAMVNFALLNHNWRNPTFNRQAPTLRDMYDAGPGYRVHVAYDRDSKLWMAVLRDEQMNIVAKPRTFDKRTDAVRLTWEDFEPYKPGET